MNYLVIDFGGTLVKYSVMDQECHVLLREERVAPVESREAFLGFIVELYERISKETPLEGIAISMPGVIDVKTGFLHSSGAYGTLAGMNVKEELKTRVPVLVSVENDGKCGALAEVWSGNLSDCEDGVVLVLGTGIGGGIIQGKKVTRGRSLAAGEFSYMLVGEQNEVKDMALCRCTVASLLYRAMLEKGIDVHKSFHYGLLSPFLGDNPFLSKENENPRFDKGMDGFAFFELLEAGDEIIHRVYQGFIKDLAQMIFNIQVTLAPEKILIGGGISRQRRLLTDLRRAVADILEDFSFLYLEVNLDVCRYGNEANQYGALYHFLKEQEPMHT